MFELAYCKASGLCGFVEGFAIDISLGADGLADFGEESEDLKDSRAACVIGFVWRFHAVKRVMGY